MRTAYFTSFGAERDGGIVVASPGPFKGEKHVNHPRTLTVSIPTYSQISHGPHHENHTLIASGDIIRYCENLNDPLQGPVLRW
jgi:hypothetical protein